LREKGKLGKIKQKRRIDISKRRKESEKERRRRMGKRV